MKEKNLVPACAIALLILLSPVSVFGQWIENGVVVSSGSLDRMYPAIATDGSGGAIIVWHDDRNLNMDIYAQRINADGEALWTENGIPVCMTEVEKEYLRVMPDGSGGAIICWCNLEEVAPGVDVSDIYAQRIGADGNLLWASGGVPVCTAEYDQGPPHLVTDGAGGVIVAWTDLRQYMESDIYAQRIGVDGSVLWAADGIPVCEVADYQGQTTIASDGSGGAFIAWRDERTSPGAVYAQRVSGEGALCWTEWGLAVATLVYECIHPVAVSDGVGGAIVFWEGNGIVGQRINSNGNVLWDGEGITLCDSRYRFNEQAVPDGESGAFVIITELYWDYYGSKSYAWVQRISSSGVVLWGSCGIQLSRYPYPQWDEQWHAQAVTDGAGGLIVVWSNANTTYHGDILATRIDGSGNFMWPEYVDLCNAGRDQWMPVPATDGAGGAIVAWMDERDLDWDIYAQRVNSAGDITATQLRSYLAEVVGPAVRVAWTLSESSVEMEFLVSRTRPVSDDFMLLEGIDIARDGMSFACIDENCMPGERYRYRVEVEDERGRRMLFETDTIVIPVLPIALYQNVPNPFNPHTTIRYFLPAVLDVRLEIYDTAGRLIERLVDVSGQRQGEHRIEWDGTNTLGRSVSPGVYLYRLRAGKQFISRKMLLVR